MANEQEMFLQDALVLPPGEIMIMKAARLLLLLLLLFLKGNIISYHFNRGKNSHLLRGSS